MNLEVYRPGDGTAYFRHDKTLRTESTIEQADGQQFKLITLDAQDSTDIVVLWPNGERQIVWSYNKDLGGIMIPHTERPADWPTACHNCGAGAEHLGYDVAEGWTCNNCYGADSDE